MDPKTFDSLARSAAGGLSRRRVMAWLAVGGAASVIGATGMAAAQSATECTLKIVGTVRLGSSAGELLTTKSKKPGELSGDLTFTPGEDGEIEKGELLLSDGKKLVVVGQVVGRAINLRVTLPDRRVVVLLGTAAEDLAICRGAVDGLLTGPEPGDIGDWHSNARAKKSTTNSTGSSSARATATTGTGNGNGACANGQGECGKGCIDLLSDPKNCGGCDSVCGTGELCVNGVCSGGDGECAEGEITCGDMGCVAIATDVNNCGQCGNACEDPLICFNGLCCLEDEICDGVCIDMLADPNNCGACGNVCGETEFCDIGTCVGGCPDDEVDCDGECVSPFTEGNCLFCGDACAGNQFCCGDAGCIDVDTDPFNCGGCGIVCADDENCDAGACV